MAEGWKVVGEAHAAGAPIESVFVAPDSEHELLAELHDSGVRIFPLGPGVIERVADTVTPQPVMAVVGMVDVDLDDLAGRDPIVVLADVRDPGNAGTVLRSAEAAGAGGVVCCDGSVDLFNPKTVRASAGSVFHVPVVVGGDALDVLQRLGEQGLRRLGTVPRGGEDCFDADLRRPFALVLGNEASGLPAGVQEALDGNLTIPMTGRAESLNVGMAAAVLSFEAMRQRRAGSGAGAGAR